MPSFATRTPRRTESPLWSTFWSLPGLRHFGESGFITLGGVGWAVGGRHNQTDQVGKRGHAGPLHHGGPMVLDGALTDAEVVSDDLVRTSLNDEVHDVALARRQAGEPLGCRLAPLGKLPRIPDALERMSDARQKLVGANGLLQKVGGSGLHRSCRRRTVGMAGGRC